MKLSNRCEQHDGDKRYVSGVVYWDDLLDCLDEPSVFEQIASYCKDAVEQGTVEALKKEFLEQGVYVELPL